MLTITDAVESLVRERAVVADGLERNLFNLSALARELLPDVERRVKKEVKASAVLMALARMGKRLRKSPRSQRTNRAFKDFTLRSHLVELTYANSPGMVNAQHVLFSEMRNMQNVVCTISNGAFETTIITSQVLEETVRRVFSGERLISTYKDLSSISITFDPEIVETLGAYAWLLNVIAWEGINIVEVVSTYTELTVVVREKDIDRAFTALHAALKKR